MNGHICSVEKKKTKNKVEKRRHTQKHKFFLADSSYLHHIFGLLLIFPLSLFCRVVCFSRSSRTQMPYIVIYFRINYMSVAFESGKSEYLHRSRTRLQYTRMHTRCRIEEKYLICVSEIECCLFPSRHRRHRCCLLCILNNSAARAHKM